jgi:hypothetical protein
MQNTHFALRAAVCAVALMMALFFLLSGIFLGKDNNFRLYGLLCFFFTGYSVYPVVKTIFRSGMAWYGFENLCFVMMFFCVCLLLRRLVGRKGLVSGRAGGIFLGFCAFVCVCAILRAIFPSDDLRLMVAYSYLIGFYKWAVAVFLALGAVQTVSKAGSPHAKTILFGIIVFDCALLMDRLLPLFEPVVFGWFTEIAGFAIVATLGVVMGQMLARQYRDKLALEDRVANISRLVEMQKTYATVMGEGIEEARHARHDLRYHLNAIRGFTLAGQYDELASYLDQYQSNVNRMTTLTYCENHVVDVILRHFATLATKGDVRFSVDAGVPEKLPIDSADACSVISNLLENALDACGYVVTNRWVDVTIKEIRSNFVIIVKNCFDGWMDENNGAFFSRKRTGAGLGIASVKMVAEKYGGTLKCETKDDTFTATVYMQL